VDSAPAPVKRDPLEALRAAFGTGDLRRLQFGWAATSVGSWAFMVVLAVYAYDVGGASAVGVAALVRMLPAAFTAPVTSLLADRSSRRDVMVPPTLVTRLARFEATTEVPERQFALLRSLSLFAPLSLATVETLAARLIPVTVETGEQVIRQGEHGDRFYVVAEGRVTVECDGELARVDGPGEFFGEIALLRDTPRTATVYATEPGSLYALERETFVSSVTNNPRSVIAAGDVIEARLAPV
jgi:hypothetical protein